MEERSLIGETVKEQPQKLSISKFEYVLIHIIAIFLIYSGINSTLKMILIWLNGGINIDLGLLFILIGRGLLRKSYGWLVTLRVIVVFFLIITVLSYLNFGRVLFALNNGNAMTQLFVVMTPIVLIGTTYFIYRKNISKYYKEKIKNKNAFALIFTILIFYTLFMLFVIQPLFFNNTKNFQQKIKIHKKIIFQQR
ncbi:hypothetical protein AAEX28_11960 [Lentisphaerota bacterium WC36G]|nr:hypothetical protein LJT99_14795 [Lentisphaerae bacterium WC36]